MFLLIFKVVQLLHHLAGLSSVSCCRNVVGYSSSTLEAISQGRGSTRKRVVREKEIKEEKNKIQLNPIFF
jgi:hypothetical protein